MFDSITATLRGRKTYLVSLAMLLFAISGLFLGQLDSNQATTVILEALAIAGLRAGIAGK